MKLKVICGLLALVMFLSVAALPMAVYATDAPEVTTDDGLWHVSDNMLAMLKELEGFYAIPYEDYKQWSIGYGSYCPVDMVPYYQQNPITEEQAEQMLLNELASIETKINNFIKDNNLQHITQNKYDALVSITYNLGDGWSKEMNGNLRKAVVSGDNGSIFAYSLILWSKAGGRYILMNRRMREALMYIRGEENSLAVANQYFRYVFMNGNGGDVNYAIHGFYTEDPIAVRTEIKKAPTGPDESGTIVTYVFDGWYTQSVGGTKVETLDSSLSTGSVLYAQWKTPNGTPVNPAQTGVSLDVTVTRNGINVRTGPDTYYPSVGKVNSGDILTITDVRVVGSRTWGRFGDNWVCLIDGGTEYVNYNSLFPLAATVTADGVSVRDSASFGAAIIAQKNRGDQISITGLVSDGLHLWGQIDGGYIAMSDVTFGELPQEKAKVTFKLEDGTVLSEKEYIIGSEVDQPQVAARPGDGDDVYIFKGWDKEVTNCTGEETYTAVFEVKRMVGDTNKDGVLDDQDAIYLLRHVWFADLYPFGGTKDLNADGSVDDQDAIYLLRHVWFPDMYPLPN